MSKSFFYRNLKKEYPTISSGNGVWLTDTNGKKYLDGCSGAVSANIGHNVAEINEAINEQLQKVAFAHTSQFVSEPALALAELLIGIAPRRFKNGRVYFASGGSEAIETAIKLARDYYFESTQYQKRIVISRKGSYHGSTIGALSATGHSPRRKPYLPLLADSNHVSASYPYRCKCQVDGVCASEECAKQLAVELDQRIEAIGAQNVLAFIAEPIVGAALGAVEPHPGYFKLVRQVCDKHSVLMIADEVMTGLGRTGEYHSLSSFGVEADIVVLGKGLAAGYMPLSAVLASATIVDAFQRGNGVFEHGFTYSAHPVSCAAGLAVMRYVQREELLANVKTLEGTLAKGLSELYEHGIIGDVRGRGFLWGLEFVSEQKNKMPFPSELRMSQRFAAEAMRLGLMVYPGAGSVDGIKGDHVIIAPPLNITESELLELLSKLNSTVKSISNGVAKLTKLS